jgi:hypothetical protein
MPNFITAVLHHRSCLYLIPLLRRRRWSVHRTGCEFEIEKNKVQVSKALITVLGERIGVVHLEDYSNKLKTRFLERTDRDPSSPKPLYSST